MNPAWKILRTMVMFTSSVIIKGSEKQPMITERMSAAKKCRVVPGMNAG